jgi:hypothetical protein
MVGNIIYIIGFVWASSTVKVNASTWEVPSHSMANDDGSENKGIMRLQKLNSKYSVKDGCHSQVKAMLVDSNMMMSSTSCLDECVKLRLSLMLANCILVHQSLLPIECGIEAISSDCSLKEGCLTETDMTTSVLQVSSSRDSNKKNKFDKPTQQSIVFGQSYTYIDEVCIFMTAMDVFESGVDILKASHDATEESLAVVRNIQHTSYRTFEVNRQPS